MNLDDIDADVGRRQTTSAFRGTWRITEMEVWDQDAFDLLGPAHFTFDEPGFGRFRFIAVDGDMDCRSGERAGKPLVEFSWNGADENDPACGRGWAVIDGDTMSGRIYIHRGDDSAFTAKRQELASSRQVRGGRRPRR